MKRALWVLVLWAGCTAPPASPDAGKAAFRHPHDDVLTLWHGQWLATHNSYHIQPDIDLVHWSYTHLPLDEQARNQGVRGFELDLNYVVAEDRIRVFHVAMVDAVSTCDAFTDCLAALKRFSDAAPQHFPLFVQLEPKTDVTPQNVDTFLARVEADILSVWPRERIMTPDDVTGASATLRDALQERGWPTLAQTRGKVLFVWDTSGVVRERYSAGMTTLAGKLMFVESAPGDPLAAVTILNDPTTQTAAIRAALDAHMLVRTRADADSMQVATSDYTQMNAALQSSAQVITTDHPGDKGDGGYQVKIPGGTPVRCNPVTSANAGVECTPEALEDPRALLP